jgi:hypothetical protein
VAQINYPSLNKQDRIEQANGRSHEEVLVQIFMLYDVQLGGGIVKLSMAIVNRKKQSMLNLRKPKFIKKNKPWSQINIHLQKSELIIETNVNLYSKHLSFLMLIS